MIAGMLATLTVDATRMRAAAGEGYTTATAVADALVRRGSRSGRPTTSSARSWRRPRRPASGSTRSRRDDRPGPRCGRGRGRGGARRGPGIGTRSAPPPRSTARSLVRRHRRDRAGPGRRRARGRARSAAPLAIDATGRARVAMRPATRPAVDRSRRVPWRCRTWQPSSGAKGDAPRPPRWWPAAGDGHRPRVRVRLHGPADHRRRRARRLVPARRRPQEARALPRDVRPHGRGHAGADAISRVAAECAEDLAADGVVYAEVRMAPELSTERG